MGEGDRPIRCFPVEHVAVKVCPQVVARTKPEEGEQLVLQRVLKEVFGSAMRVWGSTAEVLLADRKSGGAKATQRLRIRYITYIKVMMRMENLLISHSESVYTKLSCEGSCALLQCLRTG